MNFLRRGERRRGKVATAATTVAMLGAFQVLAIIGAGAASAATACTYNPASDTVEITVDPGEWVWIAVETTADDLDPAAPAGAILVDLNGAGWDACGSASNSNTVGVVVLGSPGTDEGIGIDEQSGGTFNSSIVWNIDLGTGTADYLETDLNDDQDNTVVATDTSFDLNGMTGEVLGMEEFYGYGGDGDDIIDGSALTDAVYFWGYGNDGDDWIAPGFYDGDDVWGNAGSDTLYYGGRTGCMYVDNGVEAGEDANCDGDLADAGDESDDLNDSFEVLQTGSGDDQLYGNGTSETFVPGDGDDYMEGGGGYNGIDWSSSSAAMTIDIPNETATGQGTDEWIDMDYFIGSDFDDVMLVDDDAPGPGVSEFWGGDGVDTVDASAATAGVAIALDILDPSGADDLENAVGSAYDDDLWGNDLRNSLWGGDGNDYLWGQEGNDTFYGGLGNDTFEGDAGADTVDYKDSPAGITADMSLGFASGEGDDSFVDTMEIVKGSAFGDFITGGKTSSGAGINFWFTGRGGKDQLTGSDSNDVLKGGAGNDKLRGGPGDDLLKGGKGKDKGWGGKGTDFCKKVEIQKGCE